MFWVSCVIFIWKVMIKKKKERPPVRGPLCSQPAAYSYLRSSIPSNNRGRMGEQLLDCVFVPIPKVWPIK